MSTIDNSRFLMMTCQVGAEDALKQEVQRRWRELRPAFSRPGFITFKVAPQGRIPTDVWSSSVFARFVGESIGKVTATTDEERVRAVWELVGNRPFDRLHVFSRDTGVAGEHGYEPGITPRCREIHAAILQAQLAMVPEIPLPSLPFASPEQRVLDVVVVDENEWWVGKHMAFGFASRRPGGICEIRLPPDAVSRAILKMEEALRWSNIPLEAGHLCIELGCAPGGSCQALLKRGAKVIGIDPAQVDPALLSHPNFTYIRRRGQDVRRREMRFAKWIFADMNVAPSYTLDTVESVVTHPGVEPRGLVLMLKLLEWELANELPACLERVRNWGFPLVRARQLFYNRQEVCLVALKQQPKPTKGHMPRAAGTRAAIESADQGTDGDLRPIGRGIVSRSHKHPVRRLGSLVRGQRSRREKES